MKENKLKRISPVFYLHMFGAALFLAAGVVGFAAGRGGIAFLPLGGYALFLLLSWAQGAARKDAEKGYAGGTFAFEMLLLVKTAPLLCLFLLPGTFGNVHSERATDVAHSFLLFFCALFLFANAVTEHAATRLPPFCRGRSRLPCDRSHRSRLPRSLRRWPCTRSARDLSGRSPFSPPAPSPCPWAPLRTPSSMPHLRDRARRCLRRFRSRGRACPCSCCISIGTASRARLRLPPSDPRSARSAPPLPRFCAHSSRLRFSARSLRRAPFRAKKTSEPTKEHYEKTAP